MKELNVRFYLRKVRTRKDGGIPVCMRVVYGHERCDFGATGVNVPPGKWDTGTCRMIGVSKKAKEANRQLDKAETMLRFLYDRQSKDKGMTLKALKESYLSFVDPRHSLPTFFQFYDRFLDDYSSGNGTVHTKSTFMRYRLVRKLFEEFLMFRQALPDIEFYSLTLETVNGFESFLRREKHYACNNTVMKKMRVLKTVVLAAQKCGYIHDNPFAGYQIRYDKVQRGYLTPVELKRIMKKKISVKRLEQVRDVFVFMCHTGLAYCDIASLTYGDIRTIDGNSWILKPRNKTGMLQKILLLKVPLMIIEKYRKLKSKMSDSVLPVISNQRMNSYLHELEDICGLEKRLTTHLARHTFATMAVNNKIQIATLSRILGHSDIKTTSIYAEIADATIAEEMKAMEKRLKTR